MWNNHNYVIFSHQNNRIASRHLHYRAFFIIILFCCISFYGCWFAGLNIHPTIPLHLIPPSSSLIIFTITSRMIISRVGSVLIVSFMLNSGWWAFFFHLRAVLKPYYLLMRLWLRSHSIFSRSSLSIYQLATLPFTLFMHSFISSHLISSRLGASYKASFFRSPFPCYNFTLRLLQLKIRFLKNKAQNSQTKRNHNKKY